MATFNTTVQLEEPAAVVDARIAASLSRLSGRMVSAQPGLIVVSRRYTPGWAITLGILGLIFFLLGLLFFLVKKTETLTISVSPRDDHGCTVVASGEADEWIIRTVQIAMTSRSARECPRCKGAIPRETDVCPHCGVHSKPWRFHSGAWWVQSDSGKWQWLDEQANVWRWYEDGTPSGIGPVEAPAAAVEASPQDPPVLSTPEPVSAAAEIEQLAALRERGVLTDEEFQAAKARFLGLVEEPLSGHDSGPAQESGSDPA